MSCWASTVKKLANERGTIPEKGARQRGSKSVTPTGGLEEGECALALASQEGPLEGVGRVCMGGCLKPTDTLFIPRVRTPPSQEWKRPPRLVSHSAWGLAGALGDSTPFSGSRSINSKTILSWKALSSWRKLTMTEFGTKLGWSSRHPGP